MTFPRHFQPFHTLNGFVRKNKYFKRFLVLKIMFVFDEKSNQNSLISKEIQQLFYDSSSNAPYSENVEFINENLTFNWQKIAKLCDPTDLSYENCKRIIPLYREVWREAEQTLIQRISQKSPTLIPPKQYSWTGRSDFIERILHDFVEGSSSRTSTVEATLVLSSVIEFALGNVFFTVSGKMPPHLLRDVLTMKELDEVFGKEKLFFLQILMGTPNGINLRNIVWHGFPAPQEIPPYYLCVLLMLIFSLGNILIEKNLQVVPRKIPYNPIEMANRDIVLEVPWKCYKNEEILNFLRVSDLISMQHIVFWEEILENFHRGNYASGIILILPQFELILRKIYGEVNDVDIMARIGSYYIILDTFMEEFLPGNEKVNQIHEIFCPGTLHLIHDLFMAPKGPRIRDKISHGELSLEEINDRDILDKLITLGLGVLSHIHVIKGIQHPMNNLFTFLRDYRSQFHPNGRLLIDLNNIPLKLKEMKCIKVPEDLDFELSFGQQPVPENSLSAEELKIFFRPPEEIEIVGILSKILTNALCAATNFHEGLQERLLMFNAKLLRSKRRETLIKCLKLAPKIYSWLLDLHQMVEKVFLMLQKYSASSESPNEILQDNKLKRLLRKIQKYSENLTQTTQVSTNDWIKSSTAVDRSVEMFGKVIVLLNR
ncbi:endoplasmic reticulum membrane-associated RNA degradation protein-like [Lutzomyia longipalpis]|uniref:endoplasmic reticulum membrane-associated RNA degradation protein-like n=1 Tax=Lutzomyia longipalpis TaxID=7200 RepID=UPI0024840C19|nr:endoplasmic reticulum membrane-associated RNA degradation protein-like [Lutzomyia longipalpis]